METAKTLEEAAFSAINAQTEQLELIPVEGTPYYLSRTGEGLTIFDKINKDGVDYYLGTLDTVA
jgi:hypothetical protein